MTMVSSPAVPAWPAPTNSTPSRTTRWHNARNRDLLGFPTAGAFMRRHPAFGHPTLIRLQQARETTDTLFKSVRREYLYARPIAERHRIVFYIGHLEAFDWNLLGAVLECTGGAAHYDQLFAFGIDPVSGALPDDPPEAWPALHEVHAYRDELRARLDEALVRADLSGPLQTTPGQTPGLPVLLEVAIEHRLMHAETLAYMLHQLPLAQKTGPASPTPERAHRTPCADMVSVPPGVVTLGMTHDPAGPFGWDNEFGAATLDVPGFMIDRHMVSNGAFAGFIETGGYTDARWWTNAGFAWRERHDIRQPAFWRRDAAGQWLLRTMFDEIPLPHDWPVYVSHAEAAAYTRWAGKALPTEAQWQRAAEGVKTDAPDGPGNFDFRDWNPVAVDADSSNVSRYGVTGLYGNGWEWTATLFAPLPGFAAFPFYEGYSANFFDGQHYVLKGGSDRTAACMIRPTFRNWFQPHYQYVYAGFRCVSSA
jgi:iron(II)-dependent oxidoreductase